MTRRHRHQPVEKVADELLVPTEPSRHNQAACHKVLPKIKELIDAMGYIELNKIGKTFDVPMEE